MGPALRAALVEHVRRLRHDLGKYVQLQVRWLPPEASLAERREAVCADLLRTRRGPGGVVGAAELWARSRGALVGEGRLAGQATRVDLSRDPSVRALDAAMERLRELQPELEAGTANAAQVDDAAELAGSIARAVRDLHRRLVAESG